MTKFEWRIKLEYRMMKIRCRKPSDVIGAARNREATVGLLARVLPRDLVIRASSFEFDSPFEFRHSSFRAPERVLLSADVSVPSRNAFAAAVRHADRRSRCTAR